MLADKHEEKERVETFDWLFGRHQRVLYAYLLGQVGDRGHAEDLLQQVFVRVWQHIDDAIALPEDKVRPWLFTIASNLVIDFRRRSTVRIWSNEPLDQETESEEQSPEAVVLQQETLSKLSEAIKNLPEEQRIAFTMTVLGDMSSDEVGEIMAKPAGTVRYLVSEARKRLARDVEV